MVRAPAFACLELRFLRAAPALAARDSKDRTSGTIPKSEESQIKALVVFGVAVMLLASTACGTTQHAPRPLSPELQGWWDSRFVGDPSEVSKGPSGHQMMFGTWRLHVVGDAVDLLNPEGGRPAVGKVEPHNLIEFAPDFGCADQDQVLSGVYSFAISGNSLAFSETSDSCPDRVTTLIAHPWIKGI